MSEKKVIADSDSEDSFVPARKKHRSHHNVCNEVASNMREIKNDLRSLFQISKSMKLPPGLHKQLQDSFKCNICCTSPIKPPVIFSRCCKRLLGCQECADRWFGGDEGVTRSCPLCRSERAFADTCILKGLDDFLLTIAPLMAGSGDDSESEDVPQD